MTRASRAAALVAASLLLTACDQEHSATAPSADTSDEAPDAQPARIAQCTMCHTLTEGGPHQIGPNLWGVYGAPAASKGDYAYSTALRQSGLVWDDATLDAYLASPRELVPNGKMSYAGMPDAAHRAETIAYLAQLRAPPAAPE